MSRYVFVESNTTGSGAIAVRMLRERGEQVTFVTRDRSRYPFLDGVDVIDADTNDLDALTAVVKRLSPDAVVTFSTFYVAAVAALAARLGLRFLSEHAAATCHDKIAARNALSAAGLANPDFRVIASEGAASRAAREVTYPCVMKPPADSGSSGVLLVEDEQQFLDHFRRLSAGSTNDRGQKAQPRVLVEALLDGPEFSVESVTLARGLTRVIGVTRKHLSPPPYFVETGHDFPAALPEHERMAIEGCVVRALEAVRYDFGPAHTEVRLTSRGPVVVEINPRLAGGMIPELVRLATGIDMIDVYLRMLIGEGPSLVESVGGTASIRFLTAPHAGTLQTIPGVDDLLEIAGVESIVLTARPGPLPFPPRSAYDRLGYVICTTASRADEIAGIIRARLAIGQPALANDPVAV